MTVCMSVHVWIWGGRVRSTTALRSGVCEGRVPKATWEETAGKEGASYQVGSVYLLNLIRLPGACTSHMNFSNQGEGTLQGDCAQVSVFVRRCVHVHIISRRGGGSPVSVVGLAAPGSLAACAPARVCSVSVLGSVCVSCNRQGA